MKKLFSTIILLLIINVCNSQIYKWRAIDYASRQSFNSGTSWTDWTSWNTSGVLIVAGNQRVNIYSATPQTYDMIESVLKDYDKDGNPIYSVMCVDENGTRCKMIWYHSASDGSYVLFEFSNLNLMYKVVSLD